MKEYVYRNQNGKEIKTDSKFEDILSRKGFIRKGFVDEQGATRHAMSRVEIETLYKKLDNFISDCTVQECERYKDSLIGVKTLLHQRMQE